MDILRKKDVPLADSANPYLNARRTWNSHTGSIVSANQTWTIIGLLSLFIAVASVGGVVYIGSKSKFIPYIIEVDNLGSVKNYGVASATSAKDPRIVKQAVVSFIENARLVTPDVALQEKAIFRVYSHLSQNDPATAKMNEWYGSKNPLKRAETEVVNTQILSPPIPLTEDTWQLEWSETTRDRDGSINDEPIHMKAVVTIYITDSSPDNDNNPIGVYIKDYSWDRYR